MSYLLLVLHLFIGATLAGVGIVAVLVAGVQAPGAFLAAVAGGFALAVPVARRVARAMRGD